MPFKSKAQQRLCYHLKSKGKNKNWNCDEFSDKTNFENIPDKVSSEKDASFLGRKLNKILKRDGKKTNASVFLKVEQSLDY